MTRQIGVRVTDEQYTAVEQEAERLGLSIADIVRLKLRQPLTLKETGFELKL